MSQKVAVVALVALLVGYVAGRLSSAVPEGASDQDVETGKTERSPGTSTQSIRDDLAQLKQDLYVRLDQLAALSLAEVPLGHGEVERSELDPVGPPDFTELLADIHAELDEVRTALITHRIDWIPEDLRVPKQLGKVNELVVLAQEDRKRATSRLFGWLPAQVYRKYGEPDRVITHQDGHVSWEYRRLPGTPGLDIQFVDGIVTWVR